MSEINIPQIQGGVNNIPVVPNNNINVRIIRDNSVRPLGDLRVWMTQPPVVNVPTVPIVQSIGTPIVNMPGCVEAHEQNSGKEKRGILATDDPKGVKTFCDSGMPSFNPIDYDKDKLKFPPKKTEPPKVAPPKPPETKTPEVPKTDNKLECPTKCRRLKHL